MYNLPKGAEIPQLEPIVVRLGWQTVDNWLDCGVFVMRHLETYMGTLHGWSAGLRSHPVNTINAHILCSMLYPLST